MTSRNTSRTLALMAGAILTLVALFAFNSTTARAACASYTVVNTQPCALTFYVVCGSAIGPFTVPGNSSIVVGIPAGCIPQFVPIICGNRKPVPVGGCLNNVWTGSSCCSNICQDLVNCTLKIVPSAGPCTC